MNKYSDSYEYSNIPETWIFWIFPSLINYNLAMKLLLEYSNTEVQIAMNIQILNYLSLAEYSNIKSWKPFSLKSVLWSLKYFGVQNRNKIKTVNNKVKNKIKIKFLLCPWIYNSFPRMTVTGFPIYNDHHMCVCDARTHGPGNLHKIPVWPVACALWINVQHSTRRKKARGTSHP